MFGASTRFSVANLVLAALVVLSSGHDAVLAFTPARVAETSLSVPRHSSGVQREYYGVTALAMSVPKIDDWEVLQNGRVIGTVFDHPNIPNGDTITTSPISKPEQAAARKTVVTLSGSKYILGTPGIAEANAKNADVGIKELMRRARVAFDLSGEIVGDETQQVLLAGRPTKSTSGKSLIYKAYAADKDGLPTGTAVTVKISRNWEAIEREAENYSKITKAGLWRGQFVELKKFFPDASSYTKKFRNQSALVMERGVIDLKRYISVNGRLEGKRLRDAAASAAQCLQAIHGSGLVWTDMKSENFVVDTSGAVKGIDLESAIPIKGNPVDYSPEGTPPEFATAFLAGDGPEFTLQTTYDVWSFGMLLFEMSTGRGYFQGKSPAQITKTLRDSPEIVLSEVPDPQLRNLIGKCLMVNPNQRPNVLQILLHPYFLASGLGPFSF